MPKGYTIRIFVPDGDPEGFKSIDQLNWTGKGLSFPRHKWSEVRNRKDFWACGIYILSGYGEDDVPRVYIGQGDIVGDRIDEHIKGKTFWNHCVVFVSASGLNKAHSGWLEHALIKRATEAKRCVLDNANAPKEPGLSEPDRADTEAFLAEVLRILPLVGVFAFETSATAIKPLKVEASPKAVSAKPSLEEDDIDTVIVPAYEEGFEKVFIGQNCWYEIRIAAEKLDKIKYIAVYRTAPISAITHSAPVDHIEPYGTNGKYKLVFSKPAEALPHEIGEAPTGAMQGTRYTAHKKLLAAKKFADLMAKGIGAS